MTIPCCSLLSSPPFQQHTPQKITLPRLLISSIHSEFHSYIIIILIIECYHYIIIMIKLSHSYIDFSFWLVFDWCDISSFNTSENSINLISLAWCSGRAKVWAARNWLSRSSGVESQRPVEVAWVLLKWALLANIECLRMFEDVKFKALFIRLLE